MIYRNLWICLGLVVFTATIYSCVYKFDFVKYDDPEYVAANPHVQAGITASSVKWAFTTNATGNWHPLTWLSHMAAWQIFGDYAGGHHLVNVFFHIANTLLLFILLNMMTKAVWPSAFTAAMFALHPLHIESVAWISERKDVLSTFFFLLAILAYVRYANKSKILSYIGIIIFFALGLMSKPMVVTLPFVLLLLDYWPLERNETKRWKYLIIEKIPLFLMSAASSVITFIVQRKGGAVSSEENLSIAVRLANACISYFQYIYKMILPTRLAVLYPHPGANVSFAHAAVLAIAMIVITVFVFKNAKQYKYLLVGWLWYLGTLVPVIGIVQAGAQAMADRYTYIPLIGLFIVIAWGAKDRFAKEQYKALAFGAIAILLLFSFQTLRQLRYWKNSMALFSHTLQVTQNNDVILTNFIGCLNETGKYDQAAELSRELLKRKPNSAEDHINYGTSLLHLGNVWQAIEEFEKALKIDPNNQLANFNLALTYQNQKLPEKAAGYFEKVLKLNPDDVVCRMYYAAALTDMGRYEQALENGKICLEERPKDPNVYNIMGSVYGRQGQFERAADYFKQALKIDPENASAKENLNKAQSELEKKQE